MSQLSDLQAIEANQLAALNSTRKMIKQLVKSKPTKPKNLSHVTASVTSKRIKTINKKAA